MFAEVGICLAPTIILFGSYWYGLARGPMNHWGGWLIYPAAFFGLVNLWFAWGRPWFYRQKHGSLDGYRRVSGVPLASLAILVMALGTFGNKAYALAGFGVHLMDPTGMFWAAMAFLTKARSRQLK